MRLQIGFAIALATGVVAVAVGCSVSAPSSAFGEQTIVHNQVPDGGDAAIAPEDAGVASPETSTNGSPLCLPMTDGGPAMCSPDVPASAGLCLKAPDGGTYNPTYDAAGLACRVQPSQNVSSGGVGAPTACSVAGHGEDGATCLEASDCAAGFECVGTMSPTGDAVAGACRHYCCAGNAECSAPVDTSSVPEFCDIQSLMSATTTRVPVCMPIHPAGGCPLLPAGSCPADETCAVVREDGATSCVEVGDVAAGEPCDTDHCKAGLVCLRSFGGAAGPRPLCYTLCQTALGGCTAPETCQGGLPLFQDPSVGVCR
jgi:hypothetical protein